MMATLDDLALKLGYEGGCIVSSADCSDMEIADARARDDMYVDARGYGYVRRLPGWLKKHSRYARGATDSCEQRATRKQCTLHHECAKPDGHDGECMFLGNA